MEKTVFVRYMSFDDDRYSLYGCYPLNNALMADGRERLIVGPKKCWIKTMWQTVRLNNIARKKLSLLLPSYYKKR